MGCDGGTIPRRDELVRVKKKPEQKDKDADREFRWRHCALTQQRLQEPIVACGLGRLYSKQSVIEQLLEKDKMPDAAQHIKSLKDIKQLKLTPNPAYTDEDKSEGLLDTRHAPYICKLIGLEMSGKFRFVLLWSCACVMSERALKGVKGTTNVCPLCQTPFAVEDVVLLNATADEDIEMMQAKMEMRNNKRKATKKEKKDKKVAAIKLEEKPDAVEIPQTNGEEKEAATTTKEEAPSTSKSVKVEVAADTPAHRTAPSSKIKLYAHTKRLGTAVVDPLVDPELKRLKTDYSVARDPKATDVYKSLFTTHHSEQEQSRAHWVTYNPFYN